MDLSNTCISGKVFKTEKVDTDDIFVLIHRGSKIIKSVNNT